ncbi:MAG: ParB/RepB/Spo0J family partition protein [Candidatus Eisenbacteria bacterium]|nr:ParB/RepB/Spo0J family partition protein [Candidatus Eisenbacteria bacterium]
MNRKALGRGLGALIPEAPGQEEGDAAPAVRELSVESIERNKEQPRTRFSDETLRELAESLKAHGVVQPIVVRPLPTGGYGLIVGERRLRAARMAGFQTVPAIVREVGEEQALSMALVENLQRENLNPIDEARGYEALMEITGGGHGDVAARVGKDRSTVANIIRLLELPLDVQEMLASGDLSAGHGRALLAAASGEEQTSLAKKAVSKGLSVRELEAAARGKRKRRKTTRRTKTKDPVLREWEERLQRVLGTQVRIERMGSEGTIRIEYYSEEDLERVLELISGAGERGTTP